MLRVTTFLTLLLVPSLAQAQRATPDYKQWRAACAKLPSNRDLKGNRPDKRLLPLPAFADFDQALDGFLAATRDGPLGDAKAWVGGQPDPKVFFDTTRSWFGGEGVPFQPFAAKLVLPNDAVAIVMGDLHGDVRSLIGTLDDLNERGILAGFKFSDPKYHLLFLGDYTDRGAYGVEVLYTLFRLKAANPDRVHLARGNHEDFAMASRYGFLAELLDKYGRQADITKVMRAYDRLPVVWYVGTGADCLQMNHGGMEPGYDPRDLLAAPGSPRFQLLGKLRQKAYHAARAGWLGTDPGASAVADKFLADFTPDAPTGPRAIGFMWNDFTVFADEPELGFDRALVFGPKPTRRLLADASTDRVRVRAVVRAHQHAAALNPLMSRLVAGDGVFRHWPAEETTADGAKSVKELRLSLRPAETRPIPDGSVWTFNVAPDSGYGVGCGFGFATVGLITLAPAFKDWRIKVIRVSVF
jgi:hypothetical protein